MAAAVFLRLDERKAVRTTIDAKAGPEGGGGQTVVVTLDGLADDSVRAERWTLGFEETEDGDYVLTGALRELRCHEGRGHRTSRAKPASERSRPVMTRSRPVRRDEQPQRPRIDA